MWEARREARSEVYDEEERPKTEPWEDCRSQGPEITEKESSLRKDINQRSRVPEKPKDISKLSS